jgi:arginine exporter protein ArgO
LPLRRGGAYFPRVGPLVAGLVAGYAIAVPIGAIGVYLVTLSARSGLRVAAAAALGVATADGLFALLAVVGGAGLAGALASVAGPMRWAAFVALLVIAVRTAVSGIREPRTSLDATGPRHPGRGYLTFLGATLLNPATVVYFAALVVGGGAQVGSSVAAGALFVSGAACASASWQLLLASGGSVLGRLVTGEWGRVGMALVSAVLIAGLAVGTVVT